MNAILYTAFGKEVATDEEKLMNRILLISLFAATLGFAEETNLTITVDGVTYRNVRFERATPASVTIFYTTGVATIPLEKLPPEFQKRFGYDPQQAAQWQAAQQKAAPDVAEAQRKAAAAAESKLTVGYDPQRASELQTAQQKAAAEAGAALRKTVADAAEARKKAATAAEWILTVENTLVDGVIAKGCKTSDLRYTRNHFNPSFPSRPTMYCPYPVSIFLVGHPKLSELGEGNEIIVTAYKDGIAAVGSRTLEKWVYYQPMSQHVSQQQPTAPSPVVKKPTQEKPQTVEILQTVPAVADAHASELRTNVAFGFPQNDAKVLCNRPALRFSVWNDDKYLFAQAMLWTDDDSSVGKDGNGDDLGDYSQLLLDLDDDGKVTPDLDKIYYLNSRPYAPGLRYVICMSNGATTFTKSDSEGRGAIRYVKTSDDKQVRVDTYLIPLQEISKRVGDKIGVCYYAYSPKPKLSINSVTYDNYVPRNKYREYVLTTTGGAIDVMMVPEGRNDITESQR